MYMCLCYIVHWLDDSITHIPAAADASTHVVGAWWCEEHKHADVEGGAIVMTPGHALQKDWKPSDICADVCKSLQAMHTAGYLHCDIRENNVLFFSTRQCYQLIDFGLSIAATNRSYQLVKGSEQAMAAGPRVRGCLARGEETQWTVDDDYEMLMVLLGLISKA